MVKEMLIKNKDDIVELYFNGLTQQQIADKYNASKSSIARLLRSVGITSKVIITKLDECKMVELYKSGMIIKDIANQYMSNQLSSLGMIPNKSLVLEFPQWMNEELYSHFIRGYFDGDGYVSSNYNNAKLSIISTKSFCEKVKDILYKDLGINACIYLCHKNESTTTRTLQISGRNQIKKFLDYIYNNANLYLNRKYNIYQSLYTDKNNTLAV